MGKIIAINTLSKVDPDATSSLIPKVNFHEYD